MKKRRLGLAKVSVHDAIVRRKVWIAVVVVVLLIGLLAGAFWYAGREEGVVGKATDGGSIDPRIFLEKAVTFEAVLPDTNVVVGLCAHPDKSPKKPDPSTAYSGYDVDYDLTKFDSTLVSTCTKEYNPSDSWTKNYQVLKRTQTWIIEKTEVDTYNIKHVNSDNYLCKKKYSNQLFVCNTVAPEGYVALWKFEKSSAGGFEIVAADDTKESNVVSGGLYGRDTVCTANHMVTLNGYITSDKGSMYMAASCIADKNKLGKNYNIPVTTRWVVKPYGEPAICLDEWYYAKGENDVSGPYYGCADVDETEKLRCATKAVYYSGGSYGTVFKECGIKNGNVLTDGCVNGAWYYAVGEGEVKGPFYGCSEYGSPEKPWCATKVAYVAGAQFGTTWKECSKKSPQSQEEAYTMTTELTGKDCSKENELHTEGGKFVTHICAGGKWQSLEKWDPLAGVNFADDAVTFGNKCLSEWYYAKDEKTVLGPYKGCEDVDKNGKPWCAVKAAYVQGEKYGTDWTNCYDNDDTGCVKGPWYYIKEDGTKYGPLYGCTDVEATDGGPWCATKVAYITKEKFGTKWTSCQIESKTLNAIRGSAGGSSGSGKGMKGDVNCDKDVTFADVKQINDYLAEKIASFVTSDKKSCESGLQAGDVDCKEGITFADKKLIKDYIAEKINQFPC